MTKKSKSRSKVTTSANAIESTNEKVSDVLVDNTSSGAFSSNAATSLVKNGKLSSDSSSSSGYNSVSSSKSKITNAAPSLKSIPGIVDDFLPPKFVKVLNLSDHKFEKIPPPSLAEYKAATANTDSNANKVDSTKKDLYGNLKKNKRKKSKPVKNANTNSNAGASYDSEDGRELDVLNRSYNGNARQYEDSFSSHHPSGLTSKDVSSLAQLQRIRNTATLRHNFHYEGNNIVIVPHSDNDGAQYPTSSCYDDYNYKYDEEDDVTASGGCPESASAPSDATSTLGLDHDDDDDEERMGSWSLSHNVDYDYSSKQQASSSVASSESENTASSLSTTASGSNSSAFGRGLPALAACTNIWDGVNNTCGIKDCSKPAAKKCSLCKNAFYCCEEHQRIDWKRHKNDCIPFRMESRFGDDVSVAVAAKNILQGQTIFSEKPLLVFALAEPDNDFLNVMDLRCIKKFTKEPPPRKSSRPEEQFFCTAVKPACFGCQRTVEYIGPPRSSCGTCKLPLCSYKCYLDPFHQLAECQIVYDQGGWSEDQHKCFHSLYMDIEIVRALHLEGYNTPAWERFMQLKQNLRVEAYKNSEKYQRFVRNYRVLVPISAKMSGYNEDLIGNVHAIITALSFRPSLKSAYKLLFATQILFGHDCVPNTFHYLEDSSSGKVNEMTLVTKAAVPIIKKEIITIDFSPTPFLYYPLRRMILRNVLSIDNCSCKRCSNPGQLGDYTSYIKCPRCRGTILPEEAPSWKNSVWACSSCYEEFSYQMVVKITKECREELAVILSQPRPFIIPAIQQFISRREDQDLDPGHSIIIQAWSFIEAQLRYSLGATRMSGAAPVYPETSMNDYRMLGRCCEVIEKHLQVVRPGLCYERGRMFLNRYYVELAEAAKSFQLRLTKRKEYIQKLMQCMKSLQEALKIFQVYEGQNREVAQHIQEATGALVTTKKFIQEQIMTDNEETKSRRVAAAASALSSTAALFKN